MTFAVKFTGSQICRRLMPFFTHEPGSGADFRGYGINCLGL